MSSSVWSKLALDLTVVIEYPEPSVEGTMWELPERVVHAFADDSELVVSLLHIPHLKSNNLTLTWMDSRGTV